MEIISRTESRVYRTTFPNISHDSCLILFRNAQFFESFSAKPQKIHNRTVPMFGQLFHPDNSCMTSNVYNETNAFQLFSFQFQVTFFWNAISVNNTEHELWHWNLNRPFSERRLYLADCEEMKHSKCTPPYRDRHLQHEANLQKVASNRDCCKYWWA